MLEWEGGEKVKGWFSEGRECYLSAGGGEKEKR